MVPKKESLRGTFAAALWVCRAPALPEPVAGIRNALVDGGHEVMALRAPDRCRFLQGDRDGRVVDLAVEVLHLAGDPVEVGLHGIDLLLDSKDVLDFCRILHDQVVLGDLVLVRGDLCLDIDVLCGHVLALRGDGGHLPDCLYTGEYAVELGCGEPEDHGPVRLAGIVSPDVRGRYVSPGTGADRFNRCCGAGD